LTFRSDFSVITVPPSLPFVVVAPYSALLH
jgi:hypothetical protein